MNPTMAVATAIAGGLCIFLIPYLWWAWEASRRRHRLGRAVESLDATCDQRRVTVTGIVAIEGAACGRFEDGAAAAAASVVAAQGGVNVHAERLVVRVGGQRLTIEGPVCVVVGSREVRPGTGVAGLDPAVRLRIDVSLQGPVSMRSIAAGDRVRARGLVARAAERATTDGYRAHGGWHMGPDEAGPVELAFEGWPRRIGRIGASLRGVRDRRALRAAVAALTLLLCAVVALASVGLWTSELSQTPARIELDCSDLEQRYRAERATADLCSRDEDCTGERRGDFWYDLDGCWRYSGRDMAARSAANALAERWLSAGCAQSFEPCRDALPAMCWQDRCIEKPPDGVPHHWKRQQVHRLLWLFLPPELKSSGGEWLVHDRYRIEWKSPELVARVFVSYVSSPPETCEEHFWFERAPHCERKRIDGRDALLFESEQPHQRERHRYEIVAYLPQVPCPAGACEPHEPSTTSLDATIECSDPMACNNGRLILESIDFFEALGEQTSSAPKNRLPSAGGPR